MKIAIIGGGFTGLSAARKLSEKGHEVTIFEKDSQPGGLAIGFKVKGWDWTLEKHYHHWFANDHFALSLAKKINYDVLLRRPKTSVYVDEEIFQMDSPINVLQFPKLNIAQRIRMSAVLGFLRFNPYWKNLEGELVTRSLPKLMGEKPYKLLWEPQLYNKFGDYADEVSLAWFWARIKKRTAMLAYPERGFLGFAQELEKKLHSQGAQFFYNTDVIEIVKDNNSLSVFSKKHGSTRIDKRSFEKILVTLPAGAFTKIVSNLTPSYKESLSGLKGIGAINLILRLKKPFLKNKTYWLSVCDLNAPVMAVVEHTNFMSKSHYNNEHLVYLGNYLPQDNRYFSMSEHNLLNEYDSFLQKLHPGYEKNLIAIHKFTAPFAQPIIPLNYSSKLPSFNTPIENVYLANMQQVYPWDRGTNYAVELGEKVSNLMLQGYEAKN